MNINKTQVSRLAGALLVHTEQEYYLVGDLKEPCDFAAAGFEPPAQEINGMDPPYIRLQPRGTVTRKPPYLTLEQGGEAVAAALAERLIITRNGTISERLWELILQPDADLPLPVGPAVPRRWLVEVPAPIWELVRERVLRCV